MNLNLKNVNKKKIGLLSTVLIALLAVTLATVFLTNSGLIPKATLVAYAGGMPDVKGNRIWETNVYQAPGGWSRVVALTIVTYTPGMTVSIASNTETIIAVEAGLNKTLAPDLATAASRVRVYLNVSGVVTNYLMQYYYGFSDLQNWYITVAWPSSPTAPASTWTPATDTTYTVTVQYQAYY